MDRDFLQDKRILLFIPKFFDYGEAIKACYAKLGADVTLYDERAVVSALSRAILKIFPSLFKSKSDKYYKKIIDKHKNEKIDFILIVRCDTVSEKVLKLFKKIFSNAKLCLHLWDSIENIKGITKKLKYFDYISSFDRNDCKLFDKFNFRPLFCIDEYNKGSFDSSVEENEIDVFFCGTIHSDRYRIIKSIEYQCKRLGLTYTGVHYLQSKFMYYYYKTCNKGFRKAIKNDFCFTPTSVSDLLKMVKRSKAILDIQHPGQTGLTMRTIEMLGMKKKIITTNSDIKNYDFYDPHNILIIDRNDPKIEVDFINQPFHDIPSEIWHQYSLEQWIHDVIGVESKETVYA